MDALERADMETINMKQVEEQINKKIIEWTKYYEKNSLNHKP